MNDSDLEFDQSEFCNSLAYQNKAEELQILHDANHAKSQQAN
jgi:hypothetical protein